MENKDITPIVLQQIEHELKQKPNITREEAIEIAIKITTEHTQITHFNSFLPPISYIKELTDKNPNLLAIIINEWVKRNEIDREIDLADINIQKMELNNAFFKDILRILSSFAALVFCLGFLTYPIYLGRPDISAWAAAVFTAIAIIISKIKK